MAHNYFFFKRGWTTAPKAAPPERERRRKQHRQQLVDEENSTNIQRKSGRNSTHACFPATVRAERGTSSENKVAFPNLANWARSGPFFCGCFHNLHMKFKRESYINNYFRWGHSSICFETIWLKSGSSTSQEEEREAHQRRIGKAAPPKEAPPKRRGGPPLE